MKGNSVIRSKDKLSDEAVQSLLNKFHLSRKELVTTNYVLAFKQLTEVVLKAMSPGINDPGTALNSLDYLSELLRLRMLKSDESFISDAGSNYVRVRAVTFEELLYQINASLRKYCSGDIIIVQKLGQIFLSLKKKEAFDPSYHIIIEREAKRLFMDAREAMNNETDLDTIHQLSKRFEIEVATKISSGTS